jgi:hypothetical protein
MVRKVAAILHHIILPILQSSQNHKRDTVDVLERITESSHPLCIILKGALLKDNREYFGYR